MVLGWWESLDRRVFDRFVVEEGTEFVIGLVWFFFFFFWGFQFFLVM